MLSLGGVVLADLSALPQLGGNISPCANDGNLRTVASQA